MTQLTVTVLSPATETKTLRLSVVVPEEAAPLVLSDDGQEVRDHGSANWPSKAEIVDELSRITGRVYSLGDWSEGDHLLEAIYEATLADAEGVAEQVGREWGLQMLDERPSLEDWQLGERQHVDALELCDHGALFDALKANGVEPQGDEAWRARQRLVTLMCRAAYRLVIETLEAEDDEDDGQPSDLQEHEDFAQDGDAPTYL